MLYFVCCEFIIWKIDNNNKHNKNKREENPKRKKSREIKLDKSVVISTDRRPLGARRRPCEWLHFYICLASYRFRSCILFVIYLFIFVEKLEENWTKQSQCWMLTTIKWRILIWMEMVFLSCSSRLKMRKCRCIRPGVIALAIDCKAPWHRATAPNVLVGSRPKDISRCILVSLLGHIFDGRTRKNALVQFGNAAQIRLRTNVQSMRVSFSSNRW